MIAVADSGPIRYLVLIEEVHLLPVLYGTILVPPGVAAELTHPSTPLPVHTWVQNRPEWIEIRGPRAALPELSPFLGRGEREAIALAEELGASVLLADDGAARQEAARRKIPIQGTLGILDLAAEHGLANFEAVMRKLSETNFRAGPKLIRFFMDRDAHRKSRQSTAL